MLLTWPYTFAEATAIGDPISLPDLTDFTEKFTSKVTSDLTSNPSSLASNFVVDGEIRKGEFFGIETINKLIQAADAQSATVAGIRIYYGLAYEKLNRVTGETIISTQPINDAILRPRLFLVAVDEQGKDIAINPGSYGDGPDGNGAGNGSPHPPFGDN